MKYQARLLVTSLALGVTLPLFAADAERGRMLHDQSCLSACHASRVQGQPNDIYTRKGRRDSLEKLKAQVAFCNQQVLNTLWWPEDEANVVEYLNRAFYQFK
ncbi:MAG: cytochrome c [Magnetococcales bacterium]|nr:cytochrome c [Magnetococcales bacterium]